ncbi:MAG: rod shape-determining protein MreC [Oscillospiraceae bacterium]|nr:rod shape-determining protein MreC [Oscillospiraceae bacterium]
MRDFFNSLRFKLLMAALAVITGILIYAASTGGLATLPERVFSYVLTPFQKLSAVVSDGFTDFFSVFFDARKNYDENQQLKAEVAELRRQLVDYSEAVTENERLREILDLKKLSPDLQFQDAGVIGRDPSSQFGSFTIDRGTVYGISVWDPVVTGDGLVGYISSVGPTYARVTTILSPETNVGALEITSKESGNITGTIELAEKGRTRMELLPKDTEMAVGGLVVTAGTSGYYPHGLVIGTVEKVSLSESGITKTAEIKPAADIGSVKHVFVITGFLGKQSGKDGVEP